MSKNKIVINHYLLTHTVALVTNCKSMGNFDLNVTFQSLTYPVTNAFFPVQTLASLNTVRQTFMNNLYKEELFANTSYYELDLAVLEHLDDSAESNVSVF